MQKIIVGILVILGVLTGCSDEYQEEDFEPGANGEPPRILKDASSYTRQFKAAEKNYVAALGQIHIFMVANEFSTKYTPCFDDVLNILERQSGKRFPCVALLGVKGAPPKAYLSVAIDNALFNQLNGDDHLTYTVSIYGRPDLASSFTSDIEPILDAY